MHMSDGLQDQYSKYVLADVDERVKQPAQAATRTEPESSSGGAAVATKAPKAQESRPAPSGQRVRIGKREFQLGDVRLNGTAEQDVRFNKVLFSGFGSKTETDQLHILIHTIRPAKGLMAQLGYEVSHDDPYDPFRWSKLRQIVDSGHVDILGIKSDEPFEAKEVRGKTEKLIKTTLIEHQASGITLPRRSVHERTHQPVYVASTDDSRDQIYYASEKNGRGSLGENSLAHELFGHLWLSMQGVNWGHPETPEAIERRRGSPLTSDDRVAALVRMRLFGTLKIGDGIRDPFDFPFEGLVEDFIGKFIAARAAQVESPTQGVSGPWLERVIPRLFKELRGGGLKLTGNRFDFTAELFIAWSYVSNNYKILAASPLKLSAELLELILEWFRTEATTEQQKLFRLFLLRVSEFGAGFPLDLANDTLAAIGRR
jgi:hypothetical protein